MISRYVVISAALGESGMTTAVSERSAMRVNGKPESRNTPRLGIAMKCEKPDTSMVESGSIAPRTLSRMTSRHSPCLLTSYMYWKSSRVCGAIIDSGNSKRASTGSVSSAIILDSRLSLSPSLWVGSNGKDFVNLSLTLISRVDAQRLGCGVYRYLRLSGAPPSRQPNRSGGTRMSIRMGGGL